MGKKKAKFYAVQKGITPGVYLTWDECKDQIDNYPGAKYKGFQNQEDADRFSKGLEVKTIMKESTDFSPDQHQFMLGYQYIFCDGSEIKQSQSEEKSGFGVCLLNQDPAQSIIYGEKIGTESNNRGELKAILYALNLIKKLDGNHFIIVSDSKYSINAILVWIHKWRKKNITDQKQNMDLIEAILKAKNEVEEMGKKILFKHVYGHQEKPSDLKSYDYFLWFGNQLADDAAVLGQADLSKKVLKFQYPTIWSHQS